MGKLMRRIKGGIVVDLFGVDAFLPGSQIDTRQVKNFDQFIGKEFSFKIIKLNKARRNIVVSRRAVLEEERAKLRGEIIKELEEGQVREGVVKNITDFGAFIDLGGVDGLLHITDMSWGPSRAPFRASEYRRPHQGQGAELRPRTGAHLSGPKTADFASLGSD